ncbi:pantoate kinase [Halostagnicola sp. A-GB9-2]|uniref:pantoate kinase n=1 Tax=Halostagnicola sp. A-GB9-2 TaxID=3048066 RepID=UPI0024C00312|nr:pantoate kinase [Halostagnicola sp. A-GB9-2]MDJ1432069.1 pantoate kinase [Halostagnicola sp. A-GB9-2]
MREEATAFVPGHITGFFSAHPDKDPTRAGSRGAGLTLTDGVEVTVTSASKSQIILDGEPITIDPVTTVLEHLDASARVEARSDIPLGSGFGVSGAMALGTALAANQVFDRKRSRNELVTLAHTTEVRAGTGLGDVVAQAQGGIPIRLEPGAPGSNELDGIPARARVEYVSFGQLSTADVLSGETETLSVAGEKALEHVIDEPTLETFMDASIGFAREAELLTPAVLETIEAVAERGGRASMAMLGETVFALGTGLSDAGYEPDACHTHPAGATLK